MEIKKQIDELTVQKWKFIFLEGNIFLNSYHLLKKGSKKHRKFMVIKQYERICGRDNTIKENEVPFTEELKAEVLNQFISTIKVLKWSERDLI